jgi:hypothetical protein
VCISKELFLMECSGSKNIIFICFNKLYREFKMIIFFLESIFPSHVINNKTIIIAYKTITFKQN